MKLKKIKIKKRYIFRKTDLNKQHQKV